MAFTENLDVFLADFGVTVTSGAISGIGILDMPGELVADGMIISTDYSIRCEASKFGDLLYGAAMTIDGNSYEVRDNRLVDDGAFCMITLSKITAALSKLLLEDGFYFLLEDSGFLLLEA
jgi:hypothetical protein